MWRQNADVLHGPMQIRLSLLQVSWRHRQLAVSFSALLAVMGCLFDQPAIAAEMSKTFNDCVGKVDLGAFKNNQFQACYEEEQRTDDRELNRVFVELRGKLSAERKRLLVVGEKAWLSYRNAWCEFEGTSEQAPSAEVNRLACVDEVTKAQVGRLKQSLDDPTLAAGHP